MQQSSTDRDIFNLGMIIGFLGIFIGLVLGLLITPNIDSMIHFAESFTNRALMDSYFINYFLMSLDPRS